MGQECHTSILQGPAPSSHPQKEDLDGLEVIQVYGYDSQGLHHPSQGPLGYQRVCFKEWKRAIKGSASRTRVCGVIAIEGKGDLQPPPEGFR